MSQNPPSIDEIIAMGRADFIAKQTMLYDETIKPFIMMISGLAKKLEELSAELTILKQTKKTRVIKSKNNSKKNNSKKNKSKKQSSK